MRVFGDIAAMAVPVKAKKDILLLLQNGLMWFVVHWVRQKTTFNIIIFSGRGGGFKRYGIMKTIGESNSTAKEILTP